MLWLKANYIFLQWLKVNRKSIAGFRCKRCNDNKRTVTVCASLSDTSRRHTAEILSWCFESAASRSICTTPTAPAQQKSPRQKRRALRSNLTVHHKDTWLPSQHGRTERHTRVEPRHLSSPPHVPRSVAEIRSSSSNTAFTLGTLRRFVPLLWFFSCPQRCVNWRYAEKKK